MDSAASSGRTVIGLLIGMSVSGISGALVLHHIIEPLIAGSAYAAIGFLPTIWPAHVLLGVVAGLMVVHVVAPSPECVDRPILAITCLVGAATVVAGVVGVELILGNQVDSSELLRAELLGLGMIVPAALRRGDPRRAGDGRHWNDQGRRLRDGPRY